MRKACKPGEGESVLAVPLSAQAEGLQSLEEEECAEWVQGGADIAQELGANKDGVGSGTKGLTEFEPVITLSRFCESREFARLCPIEFACPDQPV